MNKITLKTCSFKKMDKKMLWRIILVLLTFVIILSGCGGQSNEVTEGSNTCQIGWCYDFYLPTFIAIDSKDYIYVYDTTKIYKLTPVGELEGRWFTTVAIAMGIDSNDVIYVVSAFTKTVKRYDTEGSDLGEILKDEIITDIAFGEDSIFLLNTTSSKVKEVDMEGNLIREWGNKGEDAGSLKTPTQFATDSAGNFFILEPTINRLSKYSLFGSFMETWTVKTPADVALGPDNRVYIINLAFQDNRVSVYDQFGSRITTWGESGSRKGEIGVSIGGIGVDSQSFVYITDTLNGKVLIFDKGGNLINEWH